MSQYCDFSCTIEEPHKHVMTASGICIVRFSQLGTIDDCCTDPHEKCKAELAEAEKERWKPIAH